MQPEGENILSAHVGTLNFSYRIIPQDIHARLDERLLQMCLRRSALDTTETELRAIAAAANIGFSKMPKKG